MTNVFLGIIAIAVLVMAVIQVAAIVFAMTPESPRARRDWEPTPALPVLVSSIVPSQTFVVR